LARENMTPSDIQIVEMSPPDMPAALYANAVDAYCTGEPFGAAAQQAGYARPLSMTRDEWPKYICCVLTVREELIQENPAMVQDLVNQVLGAGVWLDQQQENRSKAVAIAAGLGLRTGSVVSAVEGSTYTPVTAGLTPTTASTPIQTGTVGVSANVTVTVALVQ